MYGWDNNDTILNNDDDTIKTYDTNITFTKFNDHKIVKVFDKGIVLLGVSTREFKTTPAHAGQVYYNFCSVDGTTKIDKILRTHSKHTILDKYSNSAVLSM